MLAKSYVQGELTQVVDPGAWAKGLFLPVSGILSQSPQFEVCKKSEKSAISHNVDDGGGKIL